MTSSSFNILTLAAATCAVTPSVYGHQHQQQPRKNVTSKKKPNILFLMTDQQRFDTLGWSTRGRRSLTPNFDQLAAEGVVMKSSWTSTPTCTPARAALVTGMNGWNNGMIGYTNIPRHYNYTYPQGLSEAGYLTKALGKNHFSKVPHGFQQQSLYDGLGACKHPAADGGHNCTEENWEGEWDNYDEWFSAQHGHDDPEKGLDDWNSWEAYVYPYEEYYHATVWTTRNAVDFLSNYSDARPFMFKVSWHRPHSPYDPPQRVLDQVSEADLPPLIPGGNWDHKYKECVVSQDSWCGDMPATDVTYSRRSYLANIVLIDEGVGEIISTLKRRDMYEDTWILFTSDHGDGQADHYHWRKGYPYEFSAHVNMVVRWPERYKEQAGVQIKRGSFIPAPVTTELRDIGHTFLDIGDALHTVPAGRFKPRDGKSILCLLRDPTGKKNCTYPINPGPWREYIDLEHSVVYAYFNFWSALTDGLMKYIFYADVTLPKHEELFDLVADPGEMTDLSADPAYAAELKKWRQRLVDLWTEQNRGDEWVKDGVLQYRTYKQSSPESPNYGKV